MINMRYQERHDLNYEELENSIVDSLSEISIASSIPLNIQTQDVINRTISEVVSAYLWPSDFLSNSKLYGSDIEVKDIKKNKKREAPEPIKTAWDTFDNQGSSSKKESTQNSNKFSVPTLDFSYLGDAKKTAGSMNAKPVEDPRDKSAPKPKTSSASHDGLSFTIKQLDAKPTGGPPTDQKFRSSISGSKLPENTLTVLKQEIEHLLKELKLTKSIASDANDFYDQDVESKLSKQEHEKLSEMALNLKLLLERLFEKRRNTKRNIFVEKMSREDIQLEKVDTQKELLNFEEKHGRPQTKLEKDLMRPLYDHYRKVKRILSKISSSSSVTNNVSNTSGRGFVDSHNEDNDEEDANYKDHKTFVNLHSLNLNELLREREQAVLEKARLKELIKKYEAEFAKATGRALSKEDREYHKDDFEKYKIVKAKLKLIDALIEKLESKK